MINYLYKLVFTWGKRKVKVRLGDLTFSGSQADGIFGDAKEPHIDTTNNVIDGNHRLHKLIKEEGPDHEIEIYQYIVPFWMLLITAGIIEMLKWLFNKAKALYSKVG